MEDDLLQRKTTLAETTATNRLSVDLSAIMTNAHRPRVFLDINIGEEPAGRLTIELFADKTPKTCEK